MKIESMAILKDNSCKLKCHMCGQTIYQPNLELEIDYADILSKREAILKTSAQEDIEAIVIKVAFPLGSRINNIPIKWELY